jgi:hypothetical protein
MSTWHTMCFGEWCVTIGPFSKEFAGKNGPPHKPVSSKASVDWEAGNEPAALFGYSWRGGFGCRVADVGAGPALFPFSFPFLA